MYLATTFQTAPSSSSAASVRPVSADGDQRPVRRSAEGQRRPAIVLLASMVDGRVPTSTPVGSGWPEMVLPVNVDTCTVTGAFVYADGSVPAGTVEFTPVPCQILDATAAPPTTLLAAPIVATLDEFGAIDVELPATDDADLNPVDWTYHVRVRLNGTGPGVAYSFAMAAPAGAVDLTEVTPVDSSNGTAIVVGPPGPPGADGAPGPGVPAGGGTGEVLAKLSGVDYDSDWIPASAPGVHASTHADGSTDPVTLAQSQVTGLTAAFAAKQPLDSDLTAIAALSPGSDAVIQRKVGMWVASTPTEYKTDLALTKGDVGLGNVTNTSDAAKPVSTAQQTALDLKANLSLFAGGATGQVLAKDSATDYDVEWVDPTGGGGTVFDDDSAGIVPASGGGTADFLRADGTWAQPPGVAGVSNTLTYSYNTTTTEPPTGNQLRLNSTTFSAATRMWMASVTVDGLDATIGLARILAGTQVYFQDRDNSANWVKYNVTADSVDDGAYFDIAIAYHSGPGGIPAGQIEFQLITPGTVGVPPSGGTGQVLAKESGADYDVDWIDAPAVIDDQRPDRHHLHARSWPMPARSSPSSNASAITLTVPAN